MASISAPVQRLDAIPKAEGRAAYLADLRFDGMLHARIVALLVGPDRAVLASLVARTKVEYAETKPVLSIDDSLALVGGPLHGADNLFANYTVVKGDPDAAFARATDVVEEQFSTGAQEPVYLEPQGCVAVPEN